MSLAPTQAFCTVGSVGEIPLPPPLFYRHGKRAAAHNVQRYSEFCSRTQRSGIPALCPPRRWTRRVSALIGAPSGCASPRARAEPRTAGNHSRGVPARRSDSLRGHVEAHVAVLPQHVQHRHGDRGTRPTLSTKVALRRLENSRATRRLRHRLYGGRGGPSFQQAVRTLSFAPLCR